ncbi:MAG TPA: dihydrodipicolinate reductase [Acidimicrobiia bacterium]|nr:dihydrodipicolinate reductase [Acidimicrobiia bacterium]
MVRVPARVVQWTTGNVGKESVKAIAANSELELIGCYAWSKSKDGVDVGELAGIDPLGVAATSDVDALLALKPDCVVYNPMWPSVDELVRILESGVNVVTTAAFINGRRLGEDRDRLVQACERGGSSLMGTGVSPGFAELVAVTVAGICSRVDKVTVSETADTTFYDSPDTERPVGFGHPIDDPDLHDMAREGTAVFGEAVAMVADALGVELDDIVCESEFAKTTEDVEMASWTIPAGCVAGVAASWQGRIGARTVVDLSVRWKKGSTLEPDWVIEEDGWVITVDGLPTVTTTLDFLPPADFQAESIEDFMAIGHVITALPALNSVPVVVSAPPGIVSYPDLNFPMPRGWVREESVPAATEAG